MCSPGYTFGLKDGTGAGDFTQVIWKDSVKLGMGKATKKENGMTCTYIVARYEKPGRIIGAYKENVPKGKFKKDLCEKLEDMIDKIGSGGYID